MTYDGQTRIVRCICSLKAILNVLCECHKNRISEKPKARGELSLLLTFIGNNNNNNNNNNNIYYYYYKTKSMGFQEKEHMRSKIESENNRAIERF